MPSTFSGNGLALPPMIEAKVGDGRRNHLRVEDNSKLQTSFCPELHLVLQPGLRRRTHDVVLLCQTSTMQKQVQTKSLGSGLPLRQSRSSCTACNGNSIGLIGHASVHTTSFTSSKKRMESESYLDWFCRRTNSDSLAYVFLWQEDIL